MPFECPICGQKYAMKPALNQHCKIVHDMGAKEAGGSEWQDFGWEEKLPILLNNREVRALKIAYGEGYLRPGYWHHRARGERPTINEMADSHGIDRSKFSEALSNARRKILFALCKEVYGTSRDAEKNTN